MNAACFSFGRRARCSWGSKTTWIVLGLTAAILTAAVWRQLTDEAVQPTSSERPERAPLPSQAWLAAACYGAFGYGYIIPATFLPALARDVIANPAVFSWVWPVFGAAAAISTVLAARFLPSHSPRRLWAYGQWVLAIGVMFFAGGAGDWTQLANINDPLPKAMQFSIEIFK